MEIRTRTIKKEDPRLDALTSEEELLEFCAKQINIMKKHLRLGNDEGFPSFFEINQALMGYQNVNLSLMTIYYTAKHEFNEAKTIYDNWYAERYTEIRREENPKTMAAQKFISTKEIEFILRMKHVEENTKRVNDLNLLEEKLSFMRRMLDGWKAHQFVLTQLSKNVQGEMQGREY